MFNRVYVSMCTLQIRICHPVYKSRIHSTSLARSKSICREWALSKRTWPYYSGKAVVVSVY